LNEYGPQIASWELIPSDGGKFELTVNGDLLFSKKELGRHAEEGEIMAIFKERLGEVEA